MENNTLKQNDFCKLNTKFEHLLESKVVWLLARLLLAVVFAAGGLAKLIDFQGGMAEMEQAGLSPAWLFNVIVGVGLCGGAVLIVLDRFIWLASAGLITFLLLTIVIVHSFWNISDPDHARLALFFALEHISLMGGLIAAAIASHFHNLLKQWDITPPHE